MMNDALGLGLGRGIAAAHIGGHLKFSVRRIYSADPVP